YSRTRTCCFLLTCGYALATRNTASTTARVPGHTRTGMGLIIGPEVSKRKDLPPSRVTRARAPMPFMVPMRNGPSSAAAGKHPPGRLTEVGWLARMPLSGGPRVHGVTAPLIGHLGSSQRPILPAGTDDGSFERPDWYIWRREGSKREETTPLR